MSSKADIKLAHIGQILKSAIGNNPLMLKRFSQYALWGIWEEVVGKRLADRVTPKRIQDTTLVIEVAHSAWLQELQFMKPQLLKKIHAHIDKNLIRDIRFELKEMP